MAIKPAYFAREAASNIRRSALMFVAAILAVAISLMLLGSVLVAVRIVQNIGFHFKENVSIVAFLEDSVNSDPGAVTSLETAILNMPEVDTVDYTSKAQAYEDFQELFANSPELVNEVDAETLPASFSVTLKDTQDIGLVTDELFRLTGIDDVRNAEDQVRSVEQIIRAASIFVLITAVVLLVAAAVLISNTIRLAIFARRREIGIMKLVGATNWFIRWPFMVEGLLQGLVGALVAVALIAIGHSTLIQWVTDSVRVLPLGVDTTWMWFVYGAVTLVGVLIAVGGTLFSLGRYLEV